MTIEELQQQKDATKQINKVVTRILGTTGFVQRKLTDTPKDANAVVPRKYVNANGTLANRPVASVAVIGQTYFSTDTNIPMVFNGTNWVNGVGSVVAKG